MDGINEMEMRLWAYIDGSAEPGERSAIERLIEEHQEWRTTYASLLDTHLMLAEAELEEPSMRFSMNVMEAIGREQIAPATRTYLNKAVIRGLGAFFILLISFFIGYGLMTAEGNATPGNSQLLPLPDFQFGGGLLNIFIMANVVLGLFLFDRLLSSRREQRMNDARI